MAEEIQNQDQRAVDRRRFLRGAATVAWATPVILSALTSPAGAQVNCTSPPFDNLCTCTQTSQCLAGSCCCQVGVTQPVCRPSGGANATRCTGNVINGTCLA